MHKYSIPTGRGNVAAHVLAPKQFNGEYMRRSWRYVSCVWLISTFAMVTNVAQALYRKSTRSSGGVA